LAPRAASAGIASGLLGEARRAFLLLVIGVVFVSAALLAWEGTLLARWWSGAVTLDKSRAKGVLVVAILAVFALGASIHFLLRMRALAALDGLRPDRPAEAVAWFLSPLTSARLGFARSAERLRDEKSILAF